MKGAAAIQTTEAANPRAVLGGNAPPLTEILADRSAELRRQLDTLAEKIDDTVPEIIENDEQEQTATALGLEAVDLVSALDGQRAEEKEPFLRAGKTVDDYYRPFATRAKAAKDQLAMRVARYKDAKAAAERARQRQIAEEARVAAEKLRAKQLPASGEIVAAGLERRAEDAERAAAEPMQMRTVDPATGAKSTAKQKMVARIVDFDAIPLDRLRPYLKRDAVEAALRQFVANGHTELPGVVIEPETKVNFRR